jgi:FkbM family methyltransferase
MSEGDLVKRSEVSFFDTRIIKTSDEGPVEQHTYKYSLKLPKFLHEWDVYDYWEKERIFSIEKHLSKGDTFYDVGAEHGWLPALFAKYVVGGDAMVLLEPTPEFWPNIKAIWEENELADPLFCIQALIGEETTENVLDMEHATKVAKWPLVAEGDELIPKLSYRYLHEKFHVENTPQITIDDMVEKFNIKPPKAINVDVEGAEIHVMKGAKQTLLKHRPLCWISVHPDLGMKNYNTTAEQFHEFMESCGYKKTHLATDHEEHWFYEPL